MALHSELQFLLFGLQHVRPFLWGPRGHPLDVGFWILDFGSLVLIRFRLFFVSRIRTHTRQVPLVLCSFGVSLCFLIYLTLLRGLLKIITDDDDDDDK